MPEPRYFEDFHVGETFETPDRPVSEDEIVAFAETYDPQHFHTDPGSAHESVFGTHVASGWHTAAMTMRLWVDHGPTVAGGLIGLGADDLRWGPLRPADHIRVVGEIVETRPLRKRRAARDNPSAAAHAQPARRGSAAHDRHDSCADTTGVSGWRGPPSGCLTHVMIAFEATRTALRTGQLAAVPLPAATSMSDQPSGDFVEVPDT